LIDWCGIRSSSGGLAPSAYRTLLSNALNARPQIVENFVDPQWGANSQLPNPSSSIEILAPVADPNAAGDGYTAAQAVTADVSVRMGATGMLTIANGGVRLPSTLSLGNAPGS
jgi:hypothetical protein